MQVKEVSNRYIIEGVKKQLDKERIGIHLSDLDFCLKKAFYRKLNPKPLTDKEAIMYAVGYAVQEYIYPNQEKSVEVEGLRCSPDVFEKGIEVKTTRAGMRNFDPCKPHWITRMMGYCYVTGKRTWVLDVVFVIPAEARSWEFTFSDLEIASNWKLVLQKKAILEKAFEDKEAPLLTFHQNWECGRCPFAGFCF